jgi:hypothetical protein
MTRDRFNYFVIDEYKSHVGRTSRPLKSIKLYDENNFPLKIDEMIYYDKIYEKYSSSNLATTRLKLLQENFPE